MNQAAAVYHIAKADFLERVRRYSFLLTLAFTIYFCYICIPPAHASYVTFQIDGHRPIYNSAFVGTLVSMQTTVLLSLIGFYLVKNAIERDRVTRVGQVLAATPLDKRLYLLGKALSNFAVLAAMTGVTAVAAVFMQLARAEDRTIDLWRLWAPFAFMVLPLLATVAGLAVLFEAMRWLSGGVGNVVYFFIWAAGVTIGITSESRGGRGLLDPTGFGVIIPNIRRACGLAFAACATSEDLTLGFNPGNSWEQTTFRWDGLHWTASILAARVAFLLSGVALTLVAGIFFDRFDATIEKRVRKRKPVTDEPVRTPFLANLSSISLTPVVRRFRSVAMVTAELRLALQGLKWWWYAGAAGMIVGGLVSTPAISHQFLIAAWIWPLLVWSAMGTREQRYRTGQFVFSTAHPIRRQLFACWTAGVIVSMLTGSGTAVRLAISGDRSFVLAWLIGALFIPTLALAAGVWSGSGKLFEVVYTLLWYIGPVNRAAPLDFIGASNAGPTFLAISLGLGIIAVIGRSRSIRI